MRESDDITPFWPKYHSWLEQCFSEPSDADLQECYEKDTQFDYSGYTGAVLAESDDDDDATQALY